MNINGRSRSSISFALLIGGRRLAQDSLEVYLKTGARALIDHKYQEAKTAYQNALRLAPNNLEAIKNLGVMSSATGDQQQAKIYFRTRLRRGPAQS